MLGRAHCGLALYVEEEAFCDAAGLAWEERHGDTRTANHDADSGSARIGAPARWTHILNRARAFVLEHEPVIRACAAGLLNALPTNYEVSSTKCNKLLKWIALHVPRVPLAALQGEAFEDVIPHPPAEPLTVAWAPAPRRASRTRRRAKAQTYWSLYPATVPIVPPWHAYTSTFNITAPPRFKLPARVQGGARFMQPG